MDRWPALENCGYHSLRHAWATRTAGVLPDRIRSAILGHASSRMSEGTYTHRAEEDAREAAAILAPLGYDVRPLKQGYPQLIQAGFPAAVGN